MADTDASLYHVFSGEPDNEPRWLCSIRGLEAATQEMAKFAAETPGSYFVFSVRFRKVAASMTTNNREGQNLEENTL